MIACAKWLGRTGATCTRKPDGCICEREEATILALVAERAPLPENTEIFTSAQKWERLSDVARESGNKAPNHLSETDPLWLHGWKDLWPQLRVPSNAKVSRGAEAPEDADGNRMFCGLIHDVEECDA